MLDIIKYTSIGLASAAIGALITTIVLKENDSPLNLYLNTIIEMNNAYLSDDITKMELMAKAADAHFKKCVQNGIMVHLSFSDNNESKFLNIITNKNIPYYLSGSQLMGGQRMPGNYYLEKSQFDMLSKDSKRFREITISQGNK